MFWLLHHLQEVYMISLRLDSDMTSLEIENTFAPHIENKTLTTPQVLMALQFGAIKYEQLPQNMKDEINKIRPRLDTDD